jgi:hypothetical protein
MLWVPTCRLPGRTDPGCFQYDGPPVPLALTKAPVAP